jgi:hypothetical protein
MARRLFAELSNASPVERGRHKPSVAPCVVLRASFTRDASNRQAPTAGSIDESEVRFRCRSAQVIGDAGFAQEVVRAIRQRGVKQSDAPFQEMTLAQ